MFRRLIASMLALGTLVLGATAALAGNGGDPISFTIDPAACPQIDALITGAGTISRVTHGTTYTEFASGTASDGENTYTFNYAFTQSSSASRTILTDHFNLVGSSGQQIHAHFVARFDSQGNPVFYSAHGDPLDPNTFEAACDPI